MIRLLSEVQHKFCVFTHIVICINSFFLFLPRSHPFIGVFTQEPSLLLISTWAVPNLGVLFAK